MQGHAPVLRRCRTTHRRALCCRSRVQQRGRHPGGLVARAAPARPPPDCSPRTRCPRARRGGRRQAPVPGSCLRNLGSQKSRAGAASTIGSASMLKSCGAIATQSKNGRQIASACCWSSPWNTIAIAEHPARTKCDLLAPMRIEQRLRIELDDPADQPAERVVRSRPDGGEHRAERRRQIMSLQREPRHDAEAAAATALEAPEQLRVRAGIGDPHRAVGGDDLGFEQARRSHAVRLRESFRSRRSGSGPQRPPSGSRHPGHSDQPWS